MDILANGATGQMSSTTVSNGRARPVPPQPGAPAGAAPPPGSIHAPRLRPDDPHHGGAPGGQSELPSARHLLRLPDVQPADPARRTAHRIERPDPPGHFQCGFSQSGRQRGSGAGQFGNEALDMGILRGNASFLFDMPANTILSVRFKT